MNPCQADQALHLGIVDTLGQVVVQLQDEAVVHLLDEAVVVMLGKPRKKGQVLSSGHLLQVCFKIQMLRNHFWRLLVLQGG